MTETKQNQKTRKELLSHLYKGDIENMCFKIAGNLKINRNYSGKRKDFSKLGGKP